MTRVNDQPFQRLDQTASYPYRLGEYIRRFAWVIVRATLFRWSLPRATGWRSMLLRLFGATIGKGSGMRPTARVLHPWLLEMDENSYIADRVLVYNLGPIRLGRHTVVSQDVTLCAGTHDYEKPELPLMRPPIVIGAGVWVCAEAFVGPGVTVGDNAVVGARAVVSGDVPAGAVVAGNPARVVKQRDMSASLTSEGFSEPQA